MLLGCTYIATVIYALPSRTIRRYKNSTSTCDSMVAIHQCLFQIHVIKKSLHFSHPYTQNTFHYNILNIWTQDTKPRPFL